MRPSSRPSLRARIEEARTYEDFLDRLRMFSQEQMFLIGARILSDTVSAEQAGGAFARLADVAVRALHRRVEDTLAENHGRIRRPADRAAGARQARRPRDDGDLRSRPHHRLRFRRRSIRSPTARGRSTARNISRG